LVLSISKEIFVGTGGWQTTQQKTRDEYYNQLESRATLPLLLERLGNC
jgi:hypothetical protein